MLIFKGNKGTPNKVSCFEGERWVADETLSQVHLGFIQKLYLFWRAIKSSI